MPVDRRRRFDWLGLLCAVVCFGTLLAWVWLVQGGWSP